MTTPEVSAIRDADRIIGLLESGGLRDIRLIINRLRPEMIARGDMMSVEDVLEILAVDLIGAILDDEQIVISTNQGEPLSGKNSQAEEEYRNICRRLMGEEVPYVTDALLSDIFHHRRNDYGIFLREKPLCRLCTRQDEASSCIGTHRLFSTDDEAFTERSDTCRKKIRCN